MANSQTGILRILDCSRGLSDWYPPRLEDDQLSEAWDVEFYDGAVAGRRFGCIARKSSPAIQTGHSIYVHTPTTDRNKDRIFIAYSGEGAGLGAVHSWDVNWTSPGLGFASVPDTLDFTQGVDWATLHGKLFIATKSTANRLHVIRTMTPGDPIVRTGLLPPNAPSVQSAGTGSFTLQRQYRIRWVVMVDPGTGGPLVLVARSEPSFPTPFVPPGTGLSARVSRSNPIVGEGATHWEVEEIAEDGSWYRLATVVMSQVAYDDSLALSAVPSTGILSEDVGDYTLQYSARWLAVDEDRLLLGGSFDEEAKSARVSWTPLGGQVGVGNDERLPTDVDGFLDFDMLDGGGLTGLKAWDGKVIVFKRGQVHQMVRNNSRTRAYLSDVLSRRHGALPNSIIEGVDVDGVSCLYFLDINVGPMQLGVRGLRVLCPQMQRTWRQNVNLNATVYANVTYHAEKRQVWWHVTFNPDTAPNLRWMYTVETDGLVFHSTPRPIKSATYFLTKPTLLYDIDGVWTVQIGQGDEPTMVVDYDNTHPYRAYIVTKAFQLGQLLRRFQIDSAILEADAHAGAIVYVTCRRDYGAEARSVPVLLTMPPPPAPPVPLVVVPVDNSYMTEAITMQFAIGDLTPQVSAAQWQVHGLTLAWSLGSPTTGRG